MSLSGDIISYTEARNNLKEVMDKVWDDCAPVFITRNGGRPVVVLSQEQYNGMNETDYLLSSPANASALREGMEQIKKGNTVRMKLDKNGKLVRANSKGKKKRGN
jgi:antitoxin YefM